MGYDPETRTGKLGLQLTEDYGPRKAGTVVQGGTYTTVPQIGHSPVEIYDNKSPIGKAGEGVHWGNKIVEIKEKTGTAAGSAAGLGGQRNSMGMIDPSAATSLVPNFKKGGAIKMPQEYSTGSWKLI